MFFYQDDDHYPPKNCQESLLSPDVLVNSYSRQPEDEIRVYKVRWYILAMLCFVNIFQNIMWNTWGPIQATARAVYEWDSEVIDLMAAWGTITYCLMVAPFSWLLGTKGLRASLLLAAGLQFAGGVVRCIPVEDSKNATLLMHFGQIIIGLSGGICASTLLSSTWFPPYQRTTCTAISVMASHIGSALSFIIGPLFVDDIRPAGISKAGDNYYVLNPVQKAKYQKQINKLLYFEGGAMVVIFLAIVAYYPAKPPRAPSPSAATGRVDFKTGLKQLSKYFNFILLTFLYGASTGFYDGWLSVLDQNLSEFGFDVSQKFAGWLGFVTIICGSISGIVFSSFADHFSGHLKLLLIVFMAASFAMTLLICYVLLKVILFSEILLYILLALSGFFLTATIPFFYELGVEITYPVAEGVTAGATSFSNNMLQSVFLVIPFGHVGTKWMIWVTVCTCAASTIGLLFVQETYNRSTLDRTSSAEGP